MSEQAQRARPSRICFSLPSLWPICLASILALILMMSPVLSYMRSSACTTETKKSLSVAKNTPAWITKDHTGIYARPNSMPELALVNQHALVALTGFSQRVGITSWVQVTWQTGAQSHQGWIQGSALTTQNYSGVSSASIGMLSHQLQHYLSDLGSAVGVAVYLPSSKQYYLYNAKQAFPMASSMKITIMLTILHQVEQQHRPLMQNEEQLLQAMIENSDNDAADVLYQEVGMASGVSRFLSSSALSGIDPDEYTWGTSTVSPQAMVHLLVALFQKKLLSARGTSYALSLMQHIVPDQRFGVGDTAPQEAIVSMKDGWLALDQQGWAINSSGIVQTSGITYIVSVYTMRSASQEIGIHILNRTCQQIAQALT